jgi:hypothetical protein
LWMRYCWCLLKLDFLSIVEGFVLQTFGYTW